MFVIHILEKYHIFVEGFRQNLLQEDESMHTIGDNVGLKENPVDKFIDTYSVLLSFNQVLQSCRITTDGSSTYSQFQEFNLRIETFS